VKFAERAKAYAALIGAVLTALAGTTGIIPDAATPYVTIVLAILTAFATFKIPNTPAVAKQGPDGALDITEGL
jgi:hypothetical protein